MGTTSSKTGKRRHLIILWVVALLATVLSSTTLGVGTALAGTDDDYSVYTFEFSDGTIINGSNQTGESGWTGDKNVANLGLSEGVHVSCSDDFGFDNSDPDGWGEKGAPVLGVDPFPIVEYTIDKYKGGKLDKTCGHTLPPEPAIDLEKYVSVGGVGGPWHDADSPTGPVAVTGQDVYFRFVTTNTGEITLNNVTLADTDFQSLIDSQCTIPASLAAGASFECIIGATPAVGGQHHNQGTAEGTYGLPGASFPHSYTGSTFAFTFLFADGSVIDGTSNTNSPDVGLSEAIHVSCSDDFPDGWGEKGAPVQGVDPFPITDYFITKFKNGGVDKTCGEDFSGGTVTASDPAYYLGAALRINVDPLTDTNDLVNDPDHVVTATVEQSVAVGVWTPVADGTEVRFSLANNTAGATFLAGSTCDTSGGTGQCSVTVTSTQTGSVDIGAETGPVDVGGADLFAATGTGGENSEDANKIWAALRINVDPLQATNPLDDPDHEVTATVEQSVEAGVWTSVADGTEVRFSLSPNTIGATFAGGDTCTTSSGSCAVTITSTSAGTVGIHAETGPVSVAGLDLSAATGSGGFNSDDGRKTWGLLRINVDPLTDTNDLVNDPDHVVTATVEQSVEAGVWTSVADGTEVRFSLANNTAGATFLAGSTCDTSGGTGQCSVTVTSTQTGSVDIGAETGPVDVGGADLFAATGTGGENSEDANKIWAALRINVDPLQALNALNDPAHIVTAFVEQSTTPDVWVPVAPGTRVRFSLAPNPIGATFVGARNCNTIAGTGMCSVVITSTTAGIVGIHAETGPVNVAGLRLWASTGSGGFNGPDAEKEWGEAVIHVEKSTNDEDADVAPGPFIQLGKKVIWLYEVTNPGDVALGSVTVFDDIEGAITDLIRGDKNDDGILEPGEVWVYRLRGRADLANTVDGQYANVATATGTPLGAAGTPIGGPVSDDDPSHYYTGGLDLDIEKFTIRIRDGVETAYQADSAPGPALVENQPVKWRYLVKNDGGVPASNIDVTDAATFDGVPVPTVVPLFIGGDDNSDGMLDPGEIWVYEAEGIVMNPGAGAVPGQGQYANVGTVTGEAPDGSVDSDADPSHYIAAFLEGIRLEKSTNGEDADEAPGPLIDEGKDVRWRYRVANGGNVALKDVTVVDDIEGELTLDRGDSNDNGIFDKGEAWIYLLTGTAELGQYRNVATITGTPIDVDGTVISDPVSDSDPSHYLGTQGFEPIGVVVDIEKFTIRIRDGVETAYQADSAPGPALVENQPVIWRYFVTNRGDEPALNVAVTDEATFDGEPIVPAVVPVLMGGDGNSNGMLDPGEVWVYEAEGIVLNPGAGAQPGQGQYANVGTVTAVDAAGDPASDADPSHYIAAFLEGIKLEKSTNGEDADEAPGPSIPGGKAVRWRYRVANDGNVALKDVTVVDDMEGEPTLLRGDVNNNDILDKGEAWVYRLVGSSEPGQYANVATITGTPIDVDGTVISDPVSDSDPSHYFGGVAPEELDLRIEKFTVRIRGGVETAFPADAAPGPALVENQPVKWRYVVTNRGGLPASNVEVTDAATFDGAPVTPAVVPLFVGGDDNNNGMVDPGEVWVYEAEGTVMNPGAGAQPGQGQYANVGTVTGEAPDGTVHSDQDAAHYIAAFLEGIRIEKSTNGQDADEAPGPSIEVGKAVRWRYRVANGGNVALKDVTVIDDMEGEATLDRGDNNGNGMLDQGEAWIYRITGTAEPGQYTNVATITGTPVDVDGTVISDPVSDSDTSHYLGIQ